MLSIILTINLSVIADKSIINADKSIINADKNFNFFRENTIDLYLKNHFRIFIDYAEKSKFLIEQTVEFSLLSKTIDKYMEYCDNLIESIEKSPEKLFENPKFYTIFLSNFLLLNMILSKKCFEKLVGIFQVFFMKLVEFSSENHQNSSDSFPEQNPSENHQNSSDYLISLEKLTNTFFECFDSAKKLDILQYFYKEKYIEALETQIISQKNLFSLMLFNKFLLICYIIDKKMAFIQEKIKEKNLYSRYLRILEISIIDFQNIKYENVLQFSNLLKIDDFIEEKDKETLKKCFIYRFYLLKTNKSNYSSYEDRSVAIFPINDVYHYLEEIIEVSEKNLIKHLEIAKKLMMEFFLCKQYRHFLVLKVFYQQIYSLLFIEHFQLFSSLKREYLIDNYSNKYAKFLTNMCILLYNPLIGHIVKGEINGFSSQISNFCSQVISYQLNSEEEYKMNYLTANWVKIATEKADFLFKNTLNLKNNDKDRRLLKEFYGNEGFFSMDLQLITEENYDKCVKIKELELLINIIKKINKRHRNLCDFKKFTILFDDFFIDFFDKIADIYFELLDDFLRDFITENYDNCEKIGFTNNETFIDKKEKNNDTFIDKNNSFIDKNEKNDLKINGSFLDLMTNPLQNPNEFAEILCLKKSRLIKNMFLLIKSFWYYRDSINLRAFRIKLLSKLIMKHYNKIDIKENWLEIDDLCEKNEKHHEFLLNLMKQKLFFKISSGFKIIVDIHCEKIVIKDNETLVFLPKVTRNIEFYLQVYQRIYAKSIEQKRKLNKIGDDILFILKNFYFKLIFVNFMLKDLILFNDEKFTFENAFLSQLAVIIEEFFVGNFAIFHVFNGLNELNEFATLFVQVKFPHFYLWIYKEGKLMEIETIGKKENQHQQNRFYKSNLIFFIHLIFIINFFIVFFSSLISLILSFFSSLIPFILIKKTTYSTYSSSKPSSTSSITSSHLLTTRIP